MWKANLFLAITFVGLFSGFRFMLDKYDNTPMLMQFAARDAGRKCSACLATR